MTVSYRATFVPQAWVNDYTIDVDPDGEVSWDCTAFVLAADDGWRKATLERGCDYDDILRLDPEAPEWVREYHGPFETEVEEMPFGPVKP